MRTVIHEAIADVDDATAEIVLTTHWVGGAHTEHRLPRRRGGQRNSTPGGIVEAVRALVLIAKDDVIAGILNRNGLKTGNGNRWMRERVTSCGPSTRSRSIARPKRGAVAQPQPGGVRPRHCAKNLASRGRSGRDRRDLPSC
ncbi:MAG: hypothetical protein JWR00_1539 [Rubritepida sp.]|nr:hypothetical protein [Rubritepida sp.]